MTLGSISEFEKSHSQASTLVMKDTWSAHHSTMNNQTNEKKEKNSPSVIHLSPSYFWVLLQQALTQFDSWAVMSLRPENWRLVTSSKQAETVGCVLKQDHLITFFFILTVRWHISRYPQGKLHCAGLYQPCSTKPQCWPDEDEQHGALSMLFILCVCVCEESNSL